jgi:hypothetical protein
LVRTDLLAISRWRLQSFLDRLVVGDEPIDLVDLALDLRVGLLLSLQLFVGLLVEKKEPYDFEQHDAEHDEKPLGTGLRCTGSSALVGQEVDPDHVRFSLSLRIARPKATQSCDPLV